MIYDYYITPTEYEAAKKNGVSPALLEVRIRSLAWEKERAINTLPHDKKSLKNWVEIAESNGICYSTLRYRANRLGWDLERASTQPLQDRKKQAKKASEASRTYPEEIVLKAKRNGISYDTFRHRIYLGWDIEEAATRPVMTWQEIGLMNKEKTSKSLKKLFA